MSTNPNMEAIETITATTSVASIEFTSIPQTYTDLQIVLSGRQSVAGGTNVNMKFNGSSSGYTNRDIISAAGTVISESSVLGTSSIKIGFIPEVVNYTASTFSNQYVYIPNYAGSNNKSVSTDNAMENNSTTIYFGLFAGLWSNSSAITSIALTCENGNFVQYSSATLYGITNAAAIAKATGGAITYDGTYFIHTFDSSGTFTPTQALTNVDYLVVAGGGGSGSSTVNEFYSGPGGGGGLRCTVGATGGGGALESKLSLSAQAYTVTVGAGGAGGTGVNPGSNGSNSVFSTITSNGGGGGGGSPTTIPEGRANGIGGGSGGGGGGSQALGITPSGGSGTANQGYAGGSAVVGNNNYQRASGGGGGAGAIGTNATMNPNSVGGNGGNGVTTTISGASTTYAGGGAGPGWQASGTPGTGGGGATNTSAIANFGGGGGGTSQGTGTPATSGGSGIVIIRYPAS